MISAGWILLPIAWGGKERSLWTGYFISTFAIGLNMNIVTMPYIPDII
jgi:hypothetical protein